MRIGIITSAPLPAQEGIGFYVWNLSRYLSELGHQVQIITRGGLKPTSREIVQGITIWRPTFLPIYPWHVHLHSVFVNCLIRTLEPELDLLHLHSPLVKHPLTQLPTLITVHTPMKTDSQSFTANNLLSGLIKLQIPISYKLEQELFRQAGKLTAVAHSVAQELAVYGIQPQRVAVLGNGVDTTIFTPGEHHPSSNPPYFLTVGRLGPRKGLEDLIQCAEIVVKQFPNYRFYIAGSGPLESTLKAEIKRRNLDSQVVLLGHIAQRTKLVKLYQGATAYVHAAHYEGLPTVLLEAMACACPVVATAVSGALDVVQEGDNGLLVPSRNPSQMAQAIVRLLQEPGLGEKLGKSALKTIAERYAWPVVSRNYVAQYESLLQGGEC